MIILGIETSCDETSASLIEIKRGEFKILKNIVASQIKTFQKYGGVIPELSAREHLKKIIPVIKKALPSQGKKIDYLAVTQGPGLITSLLIGLETARALAYLWKIPLLGINHLEGHIYANWFKKRKINFPLVALIVSGGHTEIVLMKEHGKYKKIGQTLDDAAGEWFDKAAKMLNLGYPGGPIIEKLAQRGNNHCYKFPRPMIKSKDFNFSFSGLKTSLLYFLKNNFKKKNKLEKELPNICASFQQAIIDVLVEKTLRAVQKFQVKTLLLAGGVAANQTLRKNFQNKMEKREMKLEFIYPDLKFCTDNAAMIALAGYFHILKKKITPLDKIKVNPQLEIGNE